jgi:CRISPR-associated Csx14 family protein
MKERRPNTRVLISSLGDSPAVVTEAIDKIESEEHVALARVVTIGTNKDDVRKSYEVLQGHIPIHYESRIGYSHTSIDSTDISDEKDSLSYLTLVAEALRHYRRLGEVYVSLAGGRKTMSALTALAVQIYGARLLCHVLHLNVDLDPVLQRKMHASHLKRYPEEVESLLHSPLEELVLVRVPVVSLFPMLNDFLAALGGQEAQHFDDRVQAMLEDGGLLEKSAQGLRVTATGAQLYRVLIDIEMLPEPSLTPPSQKKISLSEHHGKDQLLPHAERLRAFAYAERISSTDWNSGFDKTRAVRTPHGRLQVQTLPGHPDVLRVTLADSDRGYALNVYTTAQSAGQADRVQRALEEFLLGKRRCDY